MAPCWDGERAPTAGKIDPSRVAYPHADVDIPIGRLPFVPSGGQERSRLRLFLAAMDEEGAQSPVQDLPLPSDIPASDLERARRQVYKYGTTGTSGGGGCKL